MASLNTIPDELVSQVLFHLSATDSLTIQLLSRRFQSLANEPLLWRFYCQKFQFWDPEHGFKEKLGGRATDTDWKQLWLLRQRRNARIARLLDGLMASQVGRIRKFEQICALGLDAKDFLMQQCALRDDEAEDALARRYHAKRVLDSIHRGMAVKIWSRLRQPGAQRPSLEEAMGGFDMFLLPTDVAEGLDEIRQRLDSITSDFQRDTPTFGQLTTRDKALALVAWLRSHRLVGLNGADESYSNLRNRLLGQALLRNGRCSIPIISAVIYSCIAKRLGLNAAPVCFPGHVRVVVNRTMGQDLDGNTLRVGEIGWSERMFLDPFGSDDELSQREVRSIMRLYNIFDYPGTHGYAWLAAQPAELVQRNAYNILDTCHQFARHAADPETQNIHPLADLGYGDPETHVTAAVHASLWAFVLSTPVDDPLWRNHNRKFLGNIMNNWREDAWLLEKYAPRVEDDYSYLDPHERTDVESVTEVLRFIRSLDSRRLTVHRRYAEEVTRNVKYRVGQVFRHTRYGSMGVIVGWDPDGTATISAGSQATQAFVPRHLFAAGSQQEWDQFRHSRGVFYQVMDKSAPAPSIVRQDNVEIVTDPTEVDDALLFAAGRYFKRFDRDSCTFISNVKEQFPDD